jgi:hypothetical protein
MVRIRSCAAQQPATDGSRGSAPLVLVRRLTQRANWAIMRRDYGRLLRCLDVLLLSSREATGATSARWLEYPKECQGRRS